MSKAALLPQAAHYQQSLTTDRGKNPRRTPITTDTEQDQTMTCKYMCDSTGYISGLSRFLNFFLFGLTLLIAPLILIRHSSERNTYNDRKHNLLVGTFPGSDMESCGATSALRKVTAPSADWFKSERICVLFSLSFQESHTHMLTNAAISVKEETLTSACLKGFFQD